MNGKSESRGKFGIHYVGTGAVQQVAQAKKSDLRKASSCGAEGCVDNCPWKSGHIYSINHATKPIALIHEEHTFVFRDASDHTTPSLSKRNVWYYYFKVVIEENNKISLITSYYLLVKCLLITGINWFVYSLICE